MAVSPDCRASVAPTRWRFRTYGRSDDDWDRIVDDKLASWSAQMRAVHERYARPPWRRGPQPA